MRPTPRPPRIRPSRTYDASVAVRAPARHALRSCHLRPNPSQRDQPMALSSMTGFARGHGVSGAYAWGWELKSVNAKGLDLRLRLPPGWDAIEVPVRAKAGEALARGTIYATLNVDRHGKSPIVRFNEDVLNAVLGTVKSLAGRVDADRPRIDGILAIKGVMEVVEAE